MMKPPPKTAAVDDDAVWLPDCFVPGPRDVVCGWARQHHRHPGNQRFRKLVEHSAPLYMEAKTKVEKTQVIASVVQKIRRDSPCGGFIKRDFHSNRYYEIGDDKARDKVGHAIRRVIEENKKKLKKTSKHCDKKLKAARRTAVTTTASPAAAAAVVAASSGSSAVRLPAADASARAPVAFMNGARDQGNISVVGAFSEDISGKQTRTTCGTSLPLGTKLSNDSQDMLSAYLEQRETTMSKGLMGNSAVSQLPSPHNPRHSSFPLGVSSDGAANLSSLSPASAQLMQQNILLQSSSGLANANGPSPSIGLFSLPANTADTTNGMFMSHQNILNSMPSFMANSGMSMNSGMGRGPSIFSANSPSPSSITRGPGANGGDFSNANGGNGMSSASAMMGDGQDNLSVGNQFFSGRNDRNMPQSATASLFLNSFENSQAPFMGLSSQQQRQQQLLLLQQQQQQQQQRQRQNTPFQSFHAF